ncbi:MAG: hypothetical protein M3312_01370 [Actinomycetota bacterium]|nr:hypothetical protein [Actinomycetota bacterium]
MPDWAWIVIVAVAVAVVAAALWGIAAKRRSERLRRRFGGEYERTIDRRGSRRAAEAELAEREERRDELRIRPLSPAARERYSASWRDVQAKFVDDPDGAIRDADGLVSAVMRDRGYPVEDFEQRTADVSVDHPDVVENYRAAHGISMASARDEASTEDVRQAIRHYRALFEDLLETNDGAARGETVEGRTR